MIWILKDGNTVIGMHYDLTQILNAVSDIEPEDEFSIECSSEEDYDETCIMQLMSALDA